VADLIPATRPIRRGVLVPLTLTQLQTFVGGFIRFVELPTGDVIVINEASLDGADYNPTASSIAGKAGPIYGDVIHCSPSEIA
jgi:hypothetical protein